ncbi:hypothetical protein PPYR_02771 [Photinus pyralis]|uniref:UDP-glucuronosyltransferase n=1 Tax=Photinus pyralis TaxID=7054 RepID=A0A1Y1JZF0_PHOPY|nr:UDP-glucuronosyltransferase 2B33-like [Photinus pyralis]XP_031331309.1 UDP-glucuronosyltransferase 2B33-like [Photinus pyralis]XP_031331310.1 UDP-glucuronosyltransferase 2B33-like [Photinus pyralis]XP_031331312.1 UDP-glucuronosyltransferase 2B33-like [Photinus pyralis]KAB0790971.1 hypothetical protein PPYR_02771 [Photinus pyralis]
MLPRLLTVCLIISSAKAARILGYVPSPSYSHQSVFRPIWRELSLRGHHVTTLTAHPINDPRLVNLTEIDLSKALHDDMSVIEVTRIMQFPRLDAVNGLSVFFEAMHKAIDRQLRHPPIKRLIDDQETKFDLVISEYLYSSPLAFATRFGCPSIGVVSLDAWNTLYKSLGNPSHPALYSNAFMPVGDEMSLGDRFKNFVSSVMVDLHLDDAQSWEQELVRKHFGDHYPSVREMAKNISLLFVNTDPIFHQIRPLLPAVIPIGAGINRSPAQSTSLPKDLRAILDGATQGFIYFSFGSVMKTEYLPEEAIRTFSDVFAELPHVVLWKFDGDSPPATPPNVIISKWFPQKDILGHPNIKLFITQGGLQSMDEAIYAHVPMLGIPFLADQFYNVRKMANMGFGFELAQSDLNKPTVKAAILEVIANPRYKTEMKKLAKLADDQPMTGLEKAVWWSEYVIRHKGAQHLRGPLMNAPWYQYYLIDVMGVLILTLLLIALFNYVTLKFVLKFVKWLRAPNERKSR